MNETIECRGEKFKLLFSKEQLSSRVKALGSELRSLDHDLVFIIILKGSIFFGADLIRAYGKPCSLEVIRARSYSGRVSTGVVEINMTETLDLNGKHVVIIEDIVETGRTLQAVHQHLKSFSPEKVLTVSLLRKPQALENPITIDFVGFDISNEFVIGYGLDYDELARELEAVYQRV